MFKYDSLVHGEQSVIPNLHPQGPLVSTKQSSHSIAMEYANADPILATKTNVS